MLVDITVVQQL